MDIMIPFLVFFFLALVKFISRHATPSRTKQPALRLPPGPWQLPIIGSLHHLLLSRFSDLPHRALREMSAIYGPLMLLRFGSVPTLVVSSAEAAREVMRTHDIAFCSRHLSATLDIISCGGQGILFSPYNDRWRHLRKVCMLELFNQRRVLSIRPVREDEVARLLHNISSECGNGHPINLSEGICRMINDIVVRTSIGARCKYRDEFLHELDEAVRLTGGFNLADLYPSSRLVRRLSAAARDMGRCQRNIYRIIKSIMHERAVTPTPELEEDLLGVLLRLQREGGLQFALTDEILSTVIFDIFAAGSETSSTVLVWAMSELIKNPRVLQKAQSEVRETFKGRDKLCEDDMVNLSYLHLVLKEALRLHAPAPLLLPRQCRETCQVMGYDVTKGTKVFVNVWAIARDNKLWDDAEEFRPERFDGSSIDFRGTDFEYTPFGAGRRICPGIMHGLANMELVLASLLYHFDWELPVGVTYEQLDMTEAFGITVRRKSRLWLQAKPRINFLSNPK
ncbi:dolabradiene monooxygenase-like [Phragmites australis]|uniref:dolabradiene monooxygenase-like n=1 Tax=Phragmites australis TaxID=29695 RepID=UPI002D76C620|nr:dolabradiene monooxygenase-like [Phragmites australis]